MFKYRCKFTKVNYLTKSKNLTFFFRFKIQILELYLKCFKIMFIDRYRNYTFTFGPPSEDQNESL